MAGGALPNYYQQVKHLSVARYSTKQYKEPCQTIGMKMA